MRVRVDQIVVGERRREDFGDIDALAASIERFGLLHPIVVDTDLHLVAGERRLRAIKQLGWREAEVRPFGTLTESERREIELEENVRRKDLTDYERSRDLVELAKTAQHVLADQSNVVEFRTDSVQKSRGRPPSPASERRVAEHLGVPKTRIQDAEAHVAAAEQYPSMQSWKQYEVLEAKEVLDDFPSDHRDQAIALVTQPGVPPKDAITTLRNLAEMEANERERIFDLAQSGDERDRTAALTDAAKLPPMPDARLELLDDAKELVQEALAMYKNDAANDAIAAILQPFEAAYTAIEEHSRGNRSAA